MLTTSIRRFLLSALLASSAAPGASFFMTWDLQNVTFSDGRTLNGSFTLATNDASPTDPGFETTWYLSTIDISSSGGTGFSDITWQSGSPYFSFASYDDNIGEGDDLPGIETFEYDPSGNGNAYQLVLEFSDLLTSDGGTVSIVPGTLPTPTAPLQSWEQQSYSDSLTRTVTGGSVTSDGINSSTPEPRTWMLALTPLACLLISPSRNRSAFHSRNAR